MLERSINAVFTDDPAGETSAQTRERLKPNFAPGSARRMTGLGMLLGSLLQNIQPTGGDAVIYSSRFGETNALEAYLATFPTPSPTLFQTSIHPSAVQQFFIGRQMPVQEYFPVAGERAVVAHSAALALLSPASRAIWCGGDERATWMTDAHVASARAFAFALALAPAGDPAEIGRVALEPSAGAGGLCLPDWFDLLHRRQSWQGIVGEGWQLTLSWR